MSYGLIAVLNQPLIAGGGGGGGECDDYYPPSYTSVTTNLNIAATLLGPTGNTTNLCAEVQ